MLGTWLKGSTGKLSVWDGYLYKAGDECADYSGGWVEGYYEGIHSQSKESDHLYLWAGQIGLGPGQCTYVTTYKVDLTKYNTLKVDWKNEGSNYLSNESYLVVSTNKTAAHSTYNVRASKTYPFSRTVTSLNISGLSGEYYIRVHARADGNVNSKVYAYNIWLE